MNENLQAENGQKLTNLNQYILIITNINKKWFVIFEHTINHLSVSFFLVFFFFPCYPLLNR